MARPQHRINLDLLAEHIKPHMKDLVPRFAPNAKKQGNGWRLGSLRGEAGQSLFIGDQGYYDHATGEHGSYVTLFASILGSSVPATARVLADATGFRSTQLDDERAVRDIKVAVSFADLTGPHLELLRKRGFSDVVQSLPIRTASNGDLAFLHGTASGRLAFVKYYHQANVGTERSPWWSDKDQVNHVPWLMDYVAAVHPDADTLYITEGHWDAIAGTQAGFPCVSIPNGANSFHWVENASEFMASFQRVIMCYDNDRAGLEALHIASTKTNRPVMVLEMPPDCKDLNDILLRYGLEQLQIIMGNPKPYTPPQIIRASDIMHEAVEGKRYLFEYETPWGKDFPFRFRNGQTTTLTGYTGHGKSAITRQLITHIAACNTGARIGVGSFEDTPLEVTAQILEILAGHPDPKSVLDRIFFIDPTHKDFEKKRPELKTVQALFDNLYQRNGCDVFVLDNLMCMRIDREDNGAQADAAEENRQWNISRPVHSIFLAHPRKPPTGAAAEKLQPPDPHEIRGAGEIADASFNLASHVRNIPKERKIATALQTGRATPEELRRLDHESPDAVFQINKQRTGGKIPTIWLWRDQQGRFHPEPARATRWW